MVPSESYLRKRDDVIKANEMYWTRKNRETWNQAIDVCIQEARRFRPAMYQDLVLRLEKLKK